MAESNENEPRRYPRGGDAIRLAAPWEWAAADVAVGAIGVLTGPAGKSAPSGGGSITFRHSTYRDDSTISVSGGPATIWTSYAELWPTDETTTMNVWRFADDLPGAGRGRGYTVEVPVWEWYPSNGKVVLVTGGDSLFVFAYGDRRIGMQQIAMIGANLDVEQTTIKLDDYHRVLPKLFAEGLDVIDTRLDRMYGKELDEEVTRLMAAGGPGASCWNGFCIARECNGVDHVDATGYIWCERKPSAPVPEVVE